jgi:hypothetical protein
MAYPWRLLLDSTPSFRSYFQLRYLRRFHHRRCGRRRHDFALLEHLHLLSLSLLFLHQRLLLLQLNLSNLDLVLDLLQLPLPLLDLLLLQFELLLLLEDVSLSLSQLSLLSLDLATNFFEVLFLDDL